MVVVVVVVCGGGTVASRTPIPLCSGSPMKRCAAVRTRPASRSDGASNINEETCQTVQRVNFVNVDPSTFIHRAPKTQPKPTPIHIDRRQ